MASLATGRGGGRLTRPGPPVDSPRTAGRRKIGGTPLPMIVAIDGPAASGKSTAAKRVAEALGALFLDTGAMYRAVTLRVLGEGLDPGDGDACGALAEELDLRFDRHGRIQVDGLAGEPGIRSEEVTRNVSRVAALPRVRRALVATQRAMARAGSVVAEGRDTATVVFPGAEHKFFLVASPEERGRRRATEEGRPERAAEYARDLAERDKLDITRDDSPLRQADTAVRIETDDLTVDQVVERLLAHIQP